MQCIWYTIRYIQMIKLHHTKFSFCLIRNNLNCTHYMVSFSSLIHESIQFTYYINYVLISIQRSLTCRIPMTYTRQNPSTECRITVYFSTMYTDFFADPALGAALCAVLSSGMLNKILLCMQLIFGA